MEVTEEMLQKLLDGGDRKDHDHDDDDHSDHDDHDDHDHKDHKHEVRGKRVVVTIRAED